MIVHPIDRFLLVVQYRVVSAAIAFPCGVTGHGDFFTNGRMYQELHILHFAYQMIVNKQLTLIHKIRHLICLPERIPRGLAEPEQCSSKQ